MGVITYNPIDNCFFGGPSWETTGSLKLPTELLAVKWRAFRRFVAPNNPPKLQSPEDETHYLHRQDGGPNLGAQAAPWGAEKMEMLPHVFMSKRFFGGLFGILL